MDALRPLEPLRPVGGSDRHAPPPRFGRLHQEVRRRAGSALIQGLFEGLSRAGRAVPAARPSRHGVELLQDIPYLKTGRKEHTLDVYRPAHRGGPLPMVLYVHGGGFRILSKDTHWLMGLAFARQGYVVFNVNYRLAPAHPFPAALEDVAAAYAWVVEQGAAYGGDVSRLVVAGESAGGNLTLGLTLSATLDRPEPWARLVFETGVVPRAIAPACGLLEVSNPERYERMGVSRFYADRLHEITSGYLDRAHVPYADWRDLADPLVLLERGVTPLRPLPPVFAPCGDADPLVDDSRRLRRALERHRVPCEAPEYAGEGHAFHALIWRENARRCWRDHHAFLAEQLGAAETPLAVTLDDDGRAA